MRFFVMILAVAALYSFTIPAVSTKVYHVNDNNVNYRIQLCEYRSVIPVKKVELLRQIGATSVKSA